jgi:5-methylcytosine-specific restriction endonuclease McrA
VRWEVRGRSRRVPRWAQRPTGEQSVIRRQQHHRHQGRAQHQPLQSQTRLTNSKLFARDRNICAYCGGHFHEEELTREHIIPFAQNGRDHWMNVVTACRACNHRKANRTPEQARMDLLYTPYVPSLWEDFILRNRRILADQMEFLMAHLPKNSRLAA